MKLSDLEFALHAIDRAYDISTNYNELEDVLTLPPEGLHKFPFNKPELRQQCLEAVEVARRLSKCIEQLRSCKTVYGHVVVDLREAVIWGPDR